MKILTAILLLSFPLIAEGGVEEDPVIVRIGDREILYSDISCSSAIKGTSRCRKHELESLRGLMFAELVRLGAERSNVQLSDEEKIAIEMRVTEADRLDETSIPYFRCLAAGALRRLGEAVADEPECSVSEDEVRRLAEQLSTEEIRGLLARDLASEARESHRSSLTTSLLMEKVKEIHEPSERKFWLTLFAEAVAFEVDQYELRVEEVFLWSE